MHRIILVIFVFFSFESFAQWFDIEKVEGKYLVTVSDDVDYILYSTNGKTPASSGKRVKDAITFDKNSSVLFRASVGGKLLDSVVFHSFIVDQHSIPVLSIIVDEEDLWNDSTGIYCKGPNPIWNDSLKHWENCNYQQDWEKVVYMEFEDVDGTRVSQKCGLKIFGESTRRQPDKSLKLIARSKYGNNRFNYPFFETDTLSEFKQLVIRTSGNDYRGTRFKDVLNTYLARNLGLDAMAYRAVQLYVNGKYWGLYNLREKINDHYFAAHYHIDNDSVNIVMGRWVPQHGSSKRYKEMYNWFLDLDTMTDDAYLKAQEYLDIRNYINYRVFEIYINNADSRGNIRYWNSPQLNNKFRMVLYDTDLSYGTARRKLLTNFVSEEQTEWYNPEWSTMYLTKLLQNKQFKDDFVIQFAHIMNTALNRDTMLTAIDKFEKEYENELPRPGDLTEKHLRKVPVSDDVWRENINDLRSFAKMRPKYMYEELQQVFGFKSYTYFKIIGENCSVRINENYPQKLPYSGKYPSGFPLRLEFIADSNYFIQQIDSLVGLDTNRYNYLIQTVGDTLEIQIKSNKMPFVNELSTEVKAEKQLHTISSKMLLKYFAYSLIGLGVIFVLVSVGIKQKNNS